MRNTAEKVCKFIWLRAIFSSLARLIVPKLWNSLKPLRTWCRAPPSSIRRGVWRFRELYAESEVGVNHGRETAKRDSLNWKTLENKDTTLIVCPILFNTTFNQTCRATLKHLSSLPFSFLFYSSVDRLNLCTRSSAPFCLVWRCDRGCNGGCRLDDEHARGEYYF